MNAKLFLFVIVAMVSIIGMIAPIEMAVAQTDVMPDGEGKDGSHEGKSCPFKERKSASMNADLNIWFENMSNIDFTKYLNCQDCVKIEFYCKNHKAEVEKLLGMSQC